MANPFLKWAGGKQWLVENLASILPRDHGRYFEPFLGGGSVFFHFEFNDASLNDINGRLIEAYKFVRDSPDKLIDTLSSWENDQDTYYRIRGAQFEKGIGRAAQFIYLNRTCWNGLYRENRKGNFNVPYGNNGRRVIDPNSISSASRVLQGAHLSACDFEVALSGVRPRDLIYLDPPYVLPSRAYGFRRYNKTKFTWSDQKRLSKIAMELAAKGCHVIVSNAHSPSVADLYPGFNIAIVERNSNLAADSDKRGRRVEILICSFPVQSPTQDIK